MRAYAAPPFALSWLQEQTGAALTPDARGVCVVNGRGKLCGVVAYDLWTANAAFAHMATTSPIAWRTLLLAGCNYLFNETGRKIMLGYIASDNPRSLATAKHIGLTEFSRVKDGRSAGVDLVLLAMRKADCRWLTSEQRIAA
jgi:hypothetical protein